MTVAVLGLHILHLIPEIVLEFDVALVQVGDVTQELVAVVILRFYSTSTGLETHVDVLGHQHHTTPWIAGLQVGHRVQDPVVIQVGWQEHHIFRRIRHQDRKTARRFELLAPLNGHSLLHRFRFCPAQHAVNLADRLAAISGYSQPAALELVQFFKDGNGDDDVVLIEVLYGGGVVDEDVGIEDVQDGAFDLRYNLRGTHELSVAHGYTFL